MAVLMIIFVLPKLMPIPDALEPFGFYGGTNNAQEWANKPVQYADPLSCNDCHQEKHGVWVKSAHAGVSCENCHGPGKSHTQQGDSPVVDTSRDLCGSCHAKIQARPRDFPQVDLKEHGKQAECITCHNPHDPGLEVSPQIPRAPELAVIPQIPHDLKGRDDCLLCHQTGSVKPFPVDHEGRNKESCLNCHSSK